MSRRDFPWAKRPGLPTEVVGKGGPLSAITLVESSVVALAQATERNPPPLILPVKPPMKMCL